MELKDAKNSTEFRPYLRPKDVQRLYGINPATVRSWFAQRRITGAKLGKVILINHSDFLAKIKKIEAGENTDVF